MKKWLIARLDTLESTYKSSGDYLPKVAEGWTPLSALMAVLDQYGEDYRPLSRPFLIVPLDEAEVIELQPVNTYNVSHKKYEEVTR